MRLWPEHGDIAKTFYFSVTMTSASQPTLLTMKAAATSAILLSPAELKRAPQLSGAPFFCLAVFRGLLFLDDVSDCGHAVDRRRLTRNINIHVQCGRALGRGGSNVVTGIVPQQGQRLSGTAIPVPVDRV
jgi:hypothetical protein